MKKSFIDRIFPYPSGSGLPLHEDRNSLDSSQAPIFSPTPQSNANSRLQSSSNVSTLRSSSRSSSAIIRSGSLSASIIHHNDPFLPIERATRALQDTIQNLLDIQSAALGGRTDFRAADESSNGSLTPTLSAKSDTRSHAGRTIPIRQPSKKKVTLRSARNGLRKSMLDFANVREDELGLLERESQSRSNALDQVQDLENRRDALTREINAAKTQEPSNTANQLRSEATEVGNEIQELEHRLFELKLRHKNLISQAEEIESSLESKVSSYRNTLTLVEKETQEFLRRPPVEQPFGSMAVPGMFALKPHRRTLQMAKEQWTIEQEAIAKRAKEVEAENLALTEGVEVWSETLQRISQFESTLRSSTRALSQSLLQTPSDAEDATLQSLVQDLDSLINFLRDSLDHAESRNWNLLVCALGAELQACSEARDLLQPGPSPAQPTVRAMEGDHLIWSDAEKVPTTARSSPKKDVLGEPQSRHSNESLRDTLAEFAQDNMTTSSQQDENPASAKTRYESDDDGPPTDFLLSQ